MLLVVQGYNFFLLLVENWYIWFGLLNIIRSKNKKTLSEEWT